MLGWFRRAVWAIRTPELRVALDETRGEITFNPPLPKGMGLRTEYTAGFRPPGEVWRFPEDAHPDPCAGPSGPVCDGPRVGGQWYCLECGTMNHDMRQRCRECTRPRPAAGQRSTNFSVSPARLAAIKDAP